MASRWAWTWLARATDNGRRWRRSEGLGSGVSRRREVESGAAAARTAVTEAFMAVILGRRGHATRGALSGCSTGISVVRGSAAKSPGVSAVRAVIGAVSGHVSILWLSCWPCGPEKQKPRSGGRPGFSGNWLVATLCSGAPVGYQARRWLNQYPKKK